MWAPSQQFIAHITRTNTMQKHNTSLSDFISFQNIALHFVRKLS